MLVIAIGERKLGMIVDRLEGEEELVIKALDDQTVATDLISGASILGDGRVVLIVNLPAIVDRHSKVRAEAGRRRGLWNFAFARRPEDSARSRGGGALMSPVRVLVVDDSALMRKLIPQILADRQFDRGRGHCDGRKFRPEKNRRTEAPGRDP